MTLNAFHLTMSTINKSLGFYFAENVCIWYHLTQLNVHPRLFHKISVKVFHCLLCMNKEKIVPIVFFFFPLLFNTSDWLQAVH